MTPNPALAALQSLRPPAPQGGMAPANPAKDMPMAVDKPSKELFVDRSLFADKKVKKGETITITCKVTSIGASVGCMPISVDAAPIVEEGEDKFDEDLDDDAGDDAAPADANEPGNPF